MVAVDILEVPVSSQNNRYLLVAQDYFTKWADAIPLRDQTVNQITEELIKLFATYGQPQILHSDQGQNFESAILRQTLDAIGINKSRTTAYHPQRDGLVERFNPLPPNVRKACRYLVSYPAPTSANMADAAEGWDWGLCA